MSLITKIFVVVVAILSVILTALVVANAMNQKTDQDRIKVTQSKLSAAQAAQVVLQKENTLRDAETKSAKTASDTQHASDERKILDQQQALNKAETDLAAEKIKSETYRTTADSLTAENKMLLTVRGRQDARIKILVEGGKDEDGTYRDGVLQQGRQIASLNGRVNDLQSQNDAQGYQIRLDQEMIHDLKVELDHCKADALARGAGGAAVVAKPPQPEIPIEGQITKADHTDGVTFVLINVGKSDRVAKGMEFMVFRGKDQLQYLGKMIIQDVDDRTAIGYIRDEKRVIQVGDGVMTRK